MDRRIIRTRTAITSALLELTSVKRVENIKVVELCQKAGVNKSTFYLHYKDMDDCVQKCVGYLQQNVLMIASNVNYEEVANDPTNLVNALTELAFNNVENLQKLINSTMYNEIIDKIADTAITCICTNNNFDKNTQHQYIRISFLVYGIIGAIKNSISLGNQPELQRVLLSAIKRNV